MPLLPGSAGRNGRKGAWDRQEALPRGVGVDGEISPVEMLPVSPGMQGAT